jgi:hypothetical protein
MTTLARSSLSAAILAAALPACAISNTSRIVQMIGTDPTHCVWVAVDEFTGTGRASFANNAPMVTEDLMPFHDELYRCCPAKDPGDHPVCVEARWTKFKGK